MNKFVLIPHDEYSRLKDHLLNNKEKTENNEEINKHDISEQLNIDLNKNDEIKDYDKNINRSLKKDLLGIKANSLTGQRQTTEELLPPPGFPAQNKDTKILKYKKSQQSGDGKKEDWIRKWKKTIR